jgi:hypothetical protein
MEDINTEKYTEERFVPFYEEAFQGYRNESENAESFRSNEFTNNR